MTDLSLVQLEMEDNKLEPNVEEWINRTLNKEGRVTLEVKKRRRENAVVIDVIRIS